jgi:sarcosine oxidase subunit beta
MEFTRPDFLILGGGVLGSAAAWHLARGGASSVTVVDLDLAGTFSSSELNAGGCRATWWHPINCELSALSLRFYESIAKEIQFFPRGYLFLYSPRKWLIALGKRRQYETIGIPVEYLSAEDIPAILPEFENLKGVAGATFSPRDGLFDPHLVREFYRRGAKEDGVHFQDRCYVEAIATQENKVTEVRVRHWDGPAALSEESLQAILTQHRLPEDKNWKEERFHPKVVINCTGAWLPITSRLYGNPCPVQPVRRQISVFSSHEEDLSGKGMIVDSSGLYFHPEGQHSGLILAGYSNRDEKPGYSFRYDGERFFDRRIWLRLYRRGARRHFAAIHHVRGWAGLYAVGPDRTGILGKVAGFENLYELGAATGRGVMQSYALGLLTAELLLKGGFESLDGALLSRERFSRGDFLYEDLDI